MADESVKRLVESYVAEPLLSGAVLLVDDEPENLAVLGHLLEDEYRVLTASGGTEALRLAGDAVVDVVIADQRMPGMSGVEFLAKLRETQPDVAGIVLTAYADMPSAIAAINQAGAFRYLKKPWRPEEMLGTIAQAREHVFNERAMRKLVELLAARTESLTEALSAVRAAQAQLIHMERLSTMGRFAAGVVHDLRGAMVGLNYLEAKASRMEASADLCDTIRVGLAGLENLRGLLETMQEYGRESAMRVSLQPVDVASVVRDAMVVMRGDMEYRSRQVDWRPVPGLAPVTGDHNKLVQVVVNLLRNAVQATRSGQTVRIEAVHEPGRQLVIAVEDEGQGVEPAMAERLFDPFVSTKGAQGVGMGLYMTRLIVEAHGGTVTCSNRAQGGARFEVRLNPAPRAGGAAESSRGRMP
jgi:signal transduction histidine kinase